MDKSFVNSGGDCDGGVSPVGAGDVGDGRGVARGPLPPPEQIRGGTVGLEGGDGESAGGDGVVVGNEGGLGFEFGSNVGGVMTGAGQVIYIFLLFRFHVFRLPQINLWSSPVFYQVLFIRYYRAG